MTHLALFHVQATRKTAFVLRIRHLLALRLDGLKMEEVQLCCPPCDAFPRRMTQLGRLFFTSDPETAFVLRIHQLLIYVVFGWLENGGGPDLLSAV